MFYDNRAKISNYFRASGNFDKNHLVHNFHKLSQKQPTHIKNDFQLLNIFHFSE